MYLCGVPWLYTSSLWRSSSTNNNKAQQITYLSIIQPTNGERGRERDRQSLSKGCVRTARPRSTAVAPVAVEHFGWEPERAGIRWICRMSLLLRVCCCTCCAPRSAITESNETDAQTTVRTVRTVRTTTTTPQRRTETAHTHRAAAAAAAARRVRS
jgi:hypothetical protein